MEHFVMPKKDIAELLGLRIRLYVLNCERHMDTEIRNFHRNNRGLNLDCLGENPPAIYRELESSKYVPYACILILINSECECRTNMLRRVLQGMKSNPHLRYKTKLIMSAYSLNEHYRSDSKLSVTKWMLDKYNARCNSTSCGMFLHPPLKSPSSVDPPYGDDFTDCDESVLKDHSLFQEAKVENTLYMQAFIKEYMQRAYHIYFILLWASLAPMMSLNELFHDSYKFQSDFVVEAYVNADFYFYNINPALAIIINNYYFANNRDVRQGSEKDVRRLIRELKIVGIPYILVQDLSRSELQQLLEYIERKDFKPLRSFLLFLMSHGDAGNVFYTRDGQFNIDADIVQRIQNNASLEGVEKLVVSNFCRGGIDLEYASLDDLENIEPTDAQHLADNTVLLYSVPKDVQSPRDPNFGSPFISIFCRHLRNADHTQDIRSFDEKIDNDLKKHPYYYGLPRTSELVLRNSPNKPHCILTIPRRAQEMIQLIYTTIEDFPTTDCKGSREHNSETQNVAHHLKTMFCLRGSLRALQETTDISFVNQYFTPELDRDHLHDDDDGDELE